MGRANADPGWSNSTSRGVYLGNGWVLSAAHTGIVNGQAETINGQNYGVVKDSAINIKNPTALVNAGVGALADLRLVRLNTLSQFDGSPEQRAAALGLPLQPIHLPNSRLATNQQLVVIGRGRIKADGAPLLHADTSYTGGVPNWPSFTTCVGCFHTLDSNTLHAVGYTVSTTMRQTWGTNRVENPSSVANSLSDFVSKGGTWVTGTTAVQAFDFDEYNFTTDANGNVIGGGGNEVQGAANDSGSGVYAWNAALERWELSGVMHTIARYGANNQALAIRRGASALGDLTVFSELSVYRTQIEAYMAPPVGYEWNGEGTDTRFFHMVGRDVAYDAAGSLVVTEGMWGDINLDGVVSGDGSGAWATDDVTAFVQGWGYQQGSGDILSWKRGDMNQDGRVDLDDFLLLRQGVQQASGASLSLSALFGTSSQVVPEPATAGILAAAGLGLLAWRRLRRSR
ncbi:trypsin-like serine protease [Aeoliella sp. SH292]|uniref:trypsin-like serine protease n=1 Tax=Aeoliella sp. SH292 TaxID=3454464 RepID=UPI003F97386A